MELSDLGPDPFAAFHRWMDEARRKSGMENPNAMALSTVSAGGQPSTRMVLLKDYSPQGFVFFTNYESRKGKELEANPRVALCLYWDRLQRQVRIEGQVEKLPRNQSEVYFHTRGRGSQCGAWASPQSREITEREELAQKAREIDDKYRDEEIPLPRFWGGFCVRPSAIEFWQQCPSRLHDRFRFTLAGKTWRAARLAP